MAIPMDLEDVFRRAEKCDVVLAKSEWFTDPAADELEKAYSEFEIKYEAFLADFVARLERPAFTEQSDPDLRDEIYCEAVRLAGWKHNDGYWLLALGQHDKETPVFVSFGFHEL